jgi:hypothetical protein
MTQMEECITVFTWITPMDTITSNLNMERMESMKSASLSSLLMNL